MFLIRFKFIIYYSFFLGATSEEDISAALVCYEINKLDLLIYLDIFQV